MKDEIKVRKRKLSEYQADPNNPNKGSERGRRIIRDFRSRRTDRAAARSRPPMTCC